MKVGDAVKFRDGKHAFYGTDAKVGIVVEKQNYTVPDGNPNGDFTRHVKWKILFGEQTVMVKNRYHLEVINEND